MAYTQLFNGLNDIEHAQNRGVSLDPEGINCRLCLSKPADHLSKTLYLLACPECNL